METMANTLNHRTGAKGVAATLVPRLVAGAVGGILVYYGWRRERSLVGRLARTAGYSLIAKSIGIFTLARAFPTKVKATQ